jgi:hypothetical protein
MGRRRDKDMNRLARGQASELWNVVRLAELRRVRTALVKQVIPLSNPFVGVGFRHPSSMTKSSPKPREPVAGTHIYGVLMSD